MASILDIVKGLNQAASNAYDGYKNMDDEIGLRREEGHPILDSRIVDGFRVRFSADKMIVTYQSDVSMKEVHPRNQFENEIEARFGDILKFLKKEYKKVTKESVSLTEIDSLGQTSDEKLESNIKKFMELHTTKKANKAPKNPDTPKT